MKSARATNLFLMDLMFIRLPVKRLVLGPGLILTSREDQQEGHPWANMFVRMCYPTNMSLYSQKGIVDPVGTWVNARLKMYGGKGGERKCKLEATGIGVVEGSSVMLVARATSKKQRQSQKMQCMSKKEYQNKETRKRWTYLSYVLTCLNSKP